MRLVREVTTAELALDDAVEWQGQRQTVVELVDTGGRPAFGTGTLWHLTLVASDGGRLEMQSASSDRWTRL